MELIEFKEFFFCGISHDQGQKHDLFLSNMLFRNRNSSPNAGFRLQGVSETELTNPSVTNRTNRL